MKNRTTKTAILAAALALAAAAAGAQTTTPGYDRPGTDVAGRPHQHVVYWNDSMDHYDTSLQVAADAYSVNDLYDKHDSRAKKPQHDHKTHKAKETG
jgi:hypothetical protein